MAVSANVRCVPPEAVILPVGPTVRIEPARPPANMLIFIQAGGYSDRRAGGERPLQVRSSAASGNPSRHVASSQKCQYRGREAGVEMGSVFSMLVWSREHKSK